MCSKNLLPLVALLILFPALTLAQTVPDPNAKPIIVANINLSGATILKETPQAITIGLDLENQGNTPQSDIRYGIEILKTTKEGQTLVDTFISPEILTLTPKQLLHKEIQYQIPTYLNGEYDVWAISKTTNGLDLGLGNAGKVNLAQKQTSLTITPDSCLLKINNEQPTYNLAQGVDLASNETLTLTCNAQNSSNAQLTIAPVINTFRRSQYGPLVNINYPTPENITFAPQEKKDFSIIITKPTEPQAYDAVISLNQNNLPLAEKIIAHYVLQGQSATIQNISLDKTTYAKGDTITANLFWTPSADSFPNSRIGKGTELPKVTVNLTITNSNDNSCIDAFSQEVTVDKAVSTLTTPAISSCNNPKASITLSSGSKQLDVRSIESPKSPVQSQTVKTGLSAKRILFIFILVLFVVSLVIIFWKTKGKKFRVKSLIFLAFIIGGLIVGGEQAKAVTLTIGGVNTVIFNLEHPSSYIWNYQEQINMSGSFSVGECLNASTGWYVQAGGSQAETTGACTDTGGCFGGALVGWGANWTTTEAHLQSVTKNFSGSLKMPTQALVQRMGQGSHPYTRLDIKAGLSNYNIDGPAYYNFFLNLPVQPTNGVCGSANGIARTSAPSTGLCSTGSFSGITSDATAWTWTCDGSDGGTPDHCSAQKLDNGCAANTCTTDTCNNSITTVQGTKLCDNGCAANTCIGQTCDNSINPVTPGTKVCPVDNGCAANTCIGLTCNNSFAWVPGTKVCPVDNGCAANTCIGQTCNNNINPTTPGTKACPVDNGCAANTCIGQTCNNNINPTTPGTKVCDNGCAANTCTTTTCNNGLAIVPGTLVCADNSCAANTCIGQQCWNNLIFINGTKTCNDNGCAANTCTTKICNNSIGWIPGTKVCDPNCAANTCTTDTCDNGIDVLLQQGTKNCSGGGGGCSVSTTCQNSNISGIPTTCNGNPGTLQPSFAPKCIQAPVLPTTTTRCDSTKAGHCGKTITIQNAGICSEVDINGCMNPVNCTAGELTNCQNQYPATTRTCPTCKGIVIEVRPQLIKRQLKLLLKKTRKILVFF